jgi:uncharacterized protein (DUF983 family)
MTVQCPRCGTLRLGGLQICQGCGFDFRSKETPASAPQQLAGQQSSYGAGLRPSGSPQPGGYQQPAPVQSPPSSCPRCSARLYPGYQQCTNCGLDLHAAWATAAPGAPTRKSTLPIVLSLLGVLVLTFAGTLFVLSRNQTAAAPSPSRAPSLMAVATATPTPTPTETPTPAPTMTLCPSATPLASPPDTKWITLAPKGAGFTAKFPGQPKLTTQTANAATGALPTSTWAYLETADLGLYTAVVKYSKGSTAGISQGVIYDGAVTGIASTIGLRVDGQSDCTLGKHSGRAFTMSGTVGTILGQMYVVGENNYIVWVAYDSAVTDFTDINAFFADYNLTV